MFLRIKRHKLSFKSLDTESDELLVRKYFETGDKELVAVLFERYTHIVYGICLNYLHSPDQCKDAVMDIFESLFQKLTTNDIMNFRNWLYTVTKNHCLMSIRKSATFTKVVNSIKDSDEYKHSEDLAEDDLMYSKSVIQSAVDQLNTEQGACIRLMYIDDKSYREISEITGYSMNEVKSHIQNGKRNLKNYLLKQNGNS